MSNSQTLSSAQELASHNQAIQQRRAIEWPTMYSLPRSGYDARAGVNRSAPANTFCRPVAACRNFGQCLRGGADSPLSSLRRQGRPDGIQHDDAAARDVPCAPRFLSAWNGIAVNLRERVAIRGDNPFTGQAGTTAAAFLQLFRSCRSHGRYTRTYVGADDADMPALSVFSRPL